MTRIEYNLWGAKATCLRGNDLPQTKLNPEIVRAIRENRRGLTRKQLAAQYGVHYRTVEKIHYFESWTHI